MERAPDAARRTIGGRGRRVLSSTSYPDIVHINILVSTATGYHSGIPGQGPYSRSVCDEFSNLFNIDRTVKYRAAEAV